MNEKELINIIKELDADCRYCKHNIEPAQCKCATVLCDNCAFNCPCKTCRNNSNYEFKDTTEGKE